MGMLKVPRCWFNMKYLGLLEQQALWNVMVTRSLVFIFPPGPNSRRKVLYQLRTCLYKSLPGRCSQLIYVSNQYSFFDNITNVDSARHL